MKCTNNNDLDFDSSRSEAATISQPFRTPRTRPQGPWKALAGTPCAAGGPISGADGLDQPGYGVLRSFDIDCQTELPQRRRRYRPNRCHLNTTDHVGRALLPAQQFNEIPDRR